MRKIRLLKRTIGVVLMFPTIGSIFGGCRANNEEIIIPENATVIMHLQDPFPYILVTDPSGKVLQKIEILPEENHIEILPGD